MKNMKQSIARDRGLVRKLTRAFASCQKELADKLKPRTSLNALASIAAHRVLNVDLAGYCETQDVIAMFHNRWSFKSPSCHTKRHYTRETDMFLKEIIINGTVSHTRTTRNWEDDSYQVCSGEVFCQRFFTLLSITLKISV